MNHLISIDLETYSNNPNIAAIASVGMSAYDWQTGEQVDRYFAIIKQDSALQYGQSDPETMAWWGKQSAHAQRALTAGDTTIPEAMAELHQKISRLNSRAAGHWADIVARAPSFDCVILARHFKAVGLTVPWEFWQERDHRTYESAWRGVLLKNVNFPSYKDFQPVAHDAMADATAQAEYLLKLRDMVKGNV